MSLIITDHFPYNKALGVYDFAAESSKIAEMRALPAFKEVDIDNKPLTLIAYSEYGDHTLWWILATYNSIVTVDEFDNEKISVPFLQDVKRVLA